MILLSGTGPERGRACVEGGGSCAACDGGGCCAGCFRGGVAAAVVGCPG